jgi:hypothetical protein
VAIVDVNYFKALTAMLGVPYWMKDSFKRSGKDVLSVVE